MRANMCLLLMQASGVSNNWVGLQTNTVVPSQTLGSQVLADRDMEAAGTASWFGTGTLTKEIGTPHGGTQCLRQVVGFCYQGNTNVANAVYTLSGWLRGDGTNAPRIRYAATSADALVGGVANSWQEFDGLLIADDAGGFLFTNVAGYSEFDDLSEQRITPNTELVAPSANMRVSSFYTLDASPVIGTSHWLLARISSFASGNYWLVLLTYTGAQWNINLYSVASQVRTSRISATNIGTTNGIRLNMNGNLIDLETTADGGSMWTPRGSQVNNSTYNTSTGVNVISSPANTLGNAVYEPAV